MMEVIQCNMGVALLTALFIIDDNNNKIHCVDDNDENIDDDNDCVPRRRSFVDPRCSCGKGTRVSSAE